MVVKNEVHGQSIRALYPRLLYFGVSYGDLLRIPEEWQYDSDAWSRSIAEKAAQYESLADVAWRKRRKTSAMEGWRRATDYFHYAQIRLSNPLEKPRLQARSRQNYRKLVELLEPPATRIEVPFNSLTLPGYLRVAHPGAPCVVLIGGLDSSKEVELHYFADIFLSRGNSVFIFDGPGQGELCGRVPMTFNFEDAVSAVIDALAGHPLIDESRIGLFGVSFGGHLACRAAAVDSRVRACVSLGGFFDAQVFPRLSTLAVATFKRTFGLREDEDLNCLIPLITLEPLRGGMNRPLLIVHGRDDHLIDLNQIDAMSDWACGPRSVWLIEGAEHVCTNKFSECLSEIGDWASEQLAGLADGQSESVESEELYEEKVC